jgi:hypothetical protein
VTRPRVRAADGSGELHLSSYDAIIARRGKEAKNIAKIAAARKLLTLVYYGLRDGQIRALAKPAAPAPAPPAAVA